MPRLSGSRLTGLLVAALVVVIATGASVAAWLGTRGRPGSATLAAASAASAAPAAASTGPRAGSSGQIAAAGEPRAPAATGRTGAAANLAGPSSTTAAGGASAGGGASTGGSSAPMATSPAAIAASTAPTPTDPGPNTNLTVSVSRAAAGDPRAPDLQGAFQHYFDAINQHDFAAWSGAVPLAQARRQDPADWTRSYSTTSDSNITIEAIRGHAVDVRFTSEQDLDFAPADLKVGCIRWMIRYAVSERGDRWVVGSQGGGVLSRKSCA